MSAEAFEDLAREQLQFVMHQSQERVAEFFGGQSGLFDTDFELVLCEDDNLEDRFPALIRTGDPNKIYFEGTQFGKLNRDISDRYGVTRENIARLYIGSAITTAALEYGISPAYPAQVDKLYTILSDVDSLTYEINRVDETFGQEERFLTTLNIMMSDEERICSINALRFAVGALFMAEAQHGNPEFGEVMTKSFQETLHKTLAGRDNYIRLFKALGNTGEQAEQSFAEKISSLEIAVCFPMSEKEVETLIGISNYQDNRIYHEAQDTRVDAREFTGSRGFYDPVAQETRTFKHE